MEDVCSVTRQLPELLIGNEIDQANRTAKRTTCTNIGGPGRDSLGLFDRAFVVLDQWKMLEEISTLCCFD